MQTGGAFVDNSFVYLNPVFNEQESVHTSLSVSGMCASVTITVSAPASMHVSVSMSVSAFAFASVSASVTFWDRMLKQAAERV